MKTIVLANAKGGTGKTRSCTKCGDVKPVSEFYPESRRPGKYEASCKCCTSLRRKRLYGSRNNLVCVNEKRCTKCGETKSAGEFKRNRNTATGLMGLCRACVAINYKSWRRRLRDEVINAYGAACVCCGENHREFLAIDRINGGGRQHQIELNFNLHTFHLQLKRQGYPRGEYRILCYNCNMSRGVYAYCPHERRQAA